MRKTLNKKLYMKNMAAAQISTATDCDLGLVMRGTLVASAMVQKLRRPSNALVRLVIRNQTGGEGSRACTYTWRQGSGFQAQLGFENHR